MKPVEDVIACVFDYGSFISLADKLGETLKKVYYYSPYEEEFRDVGKCSIGKGLPNCQRCDEPLHPDYFEAIDLWVFPDIGFGGVQHMLRAAGKAVWGSMGASDLELYRTQFLKVLGEVGLPMVHSERVDGMTALVERLKVVEDKWIKVNRYRANMETWHHINFTHSARKLEQMAVDFGGFGEDVVFVIQDVIDTEIEIGYDGWTVDGEFPASCYQGYEKKNQLYLGSRRDYAKLPEAVRYVNEKMAPVLRKYGYRNWFATELRVKDGTPYFIDPTMRMPGQTGEHQLETCSNLDQVIWAGAHGQLVEPDWIAPFAVEATMHYKEGSDCWKTLTIPERVRRWVKLYHYFEKGGACHFPPRCSDEPGVVIGIGDDIEDAKDHLDKNLEALKEEPISTDCEGFMDLIEAIEKAEEEGIKFSDKPTPSPEEML